MCTLQSGICKKTRTGHPATFVWVQFISYFKSVRTLFCYVLPGVAFHVLGLLCLYVRFQKHHAFDKPWATLLICPRYDMAWCDTIWDIIWSDMLWCATICDMIWYDMICDMIWYDMICYDMIWFDMIHPSLTPSITNIILTSYDMIWYGMMWHDMRHDMIWHDVTWCDPEPSFKLLTIIFLMFTIFAFGSSKVDGVGVQF